MLRQLDGQPSLSHRSPPSSLSAITISGLIGAAARVTMGEEVGKEGWQVGLISNPEVSNSDRPERRRREEQRKKTKEKKG